MSQAALATRSDVRERRCIVTGVVLPDWQLVRFVAAPDAQIVPDVTATLPGRGLWVRADRESLERAIAKNAFPKAAKESVSAASDLVARTERALAQRMLSDLGLARRAGQLVSGFDNIVRALESRTPPKVLVEAADGASDGRTKLLSVARRCGLSPSIIDILGSEELSLALGRENVIHAALKSGRLAERLILDAGRLEGFRRAPEKRSASIRQ